MTWRPLPTGTTPRPSQGGVPARGDSSIVTGRGVVISVSWVPESDAQRGRLDDLESADGAPIGTSVVVVHQDPRIRTDLERELAAAGLTPVVARSCREALARARQVRAAALVTSVRIPGLDGFQLMRRARAESSLADLPIVVFDKDIRFDDRWSRAEGVDLVDARAGVAVVVGLVSLILLRRSPQAATVTGAR